jgi:hypothetical protein
MKWQFFFYFFQLNSQIADESHKIFIFYLISQPTNSYIIKLRLFFLKNILIIKKSKKKVFDSLFKNKNNKPNRPCNHWKQNPFFYLDNNAIEKIKI